MSEFNEPGGVAGAAVFGFELGFFAGNEFGAGNLFDLKAQEIELLCISAFVDNEFAFLAQKIGATRDFFREGGTCFSEFTVGIEDIELPRSVEQRLVIVRAVHVDEHFAEGGEDSERGGRAVDKLAVGASGSESALEDELVIFARFEAILFEEGGQGRDVPGGEDRFDGAAIRAAADERAIGALPEHEVQCADDYGFTGACLACDGVVARRELESEIGHEGKILDAERRQHRRIKANDGTGARKIRQRNLAKYAKWRGFSGEMPFPGLKTGSSVSDGN